MLYSMESKDDCFCSGLRISFHMKIESYLITSEGKLSSRSTPLCCRFNLLELLYLYSSVHWTKSVISGLTVVFVLTYLEC